MVCKVTVEIVVSQQFRYRAKILEGRSEALPREVHAILSAHDLANNKVLQFDYKKRVITISDSKNDEHELAMTRGSPQQSPRVTLTVQ